LCLTETSEKQIIRNYDDNSATPTQKDKKNLLTLTTPKAILKDPKN
jgi:hypothetical protein